MLKNLFLVLGKLLYSWHPINFLNACYISYCEQFIHAYISFFFICFALIMFNQKLDLPVKKIYNTTLWRCMQVFSSHLVRLNLISPSSHSFGQGCQVYTTKLAHWAIKNIPKVAQCDFLHWGAEMSSLNVYVMGRCSRGWECWNQPKETI